MFLRRAMVGSPDFFLIFCIYKIALACVLFMIDSHLNASCLLISFRVGEIR